MQASTPPSQPEDLLGQALSLQRAGKLSPALNVLQQLLAVDPANFAALHGSGVILGQMGRHEEALAFLTAAVAGEPNNFAGHYNRGKVLQQLNRREEALASYEQALSLKPDFADAYSNRGDILKELHRYDEALAHYNKAISLRPHIAEVYNNRGNALRGMKRYREALASFDEAISRKPDFAEAYYNRGQTLCNMDLHEDAAANFETAISLKPSYPEVHNARGRVLLELKRYEEALASYERAIVLKPDYAEAYNNRGVTLSGLKRYEEALSNFDVAISLKPAHVDIYNNRGATLLKMERFEDALVNFNKLIAIDPLCPYAHGDRLLAQMAICSWEDYERHVNELVERVERGELASSPFPLLAIPATSRTLQKCASHYVTDKYAPASPSTRRGKHYSHDRIRVGYFSADFRDHPIAYLTAELFEKHDRSRFEIYAFSFGPESDGDMRARLRKAFDKFFTLSEETDQEIATLAKGMEIDIAIDLMGFTKHARLGLFALHLAPIQVGYLGYPGTQGAPFMDYLIGDPTVIPVDDFAYYSEKIVQLPHCYQVNDTRRRIADAAPGRSQSGLPETGFVFCCFNNNFKITPDVFDIWMRLLAKIDDSVLWLLEANPAARRNLSREARSRGIEPTRLVFAPRTAQPEHLARHRHADLFLDTFYYGAHTTASDALWTGLPVLTCHGNTFASRVAASLLRAAGLPELITYTHEEYESMALRLATNPDILAAAKRKLEQNRTVCPLFNTDLFTRHIEDAYATMWRRHRQGLAAGHIYVPE